jgi:hypothetical protein
VIVSNPSYGNARVLEILPESLSDFISSDQSMLYEGEELQNFMETEGMSFDRTPPAIHKFISEVINENFLSVITKKIIFNF